MKINYKRNENHFNFLCEFHSWNDYSKILQQMKLNEVKW
jgi:hypothetical protein